MSDVNDRINSLINIAGTTAKPFENTFIRDGKEYYEIKVDGTKYFIFPIKNRGRKFSQSFTTHSPGSNSPAANFANIMGKIMEMVEKGEIETSKLYPEMRCCYEELIQFVPENYREYYENELKNIF